jgi:hypothetical protein
MHHTLKTIRTMAGIWASALLLSTPALAQHAGKHDEASKAREADEADAPAANRAARLEAPEKTGSLRPVSTEEARALVSDIARLVDQSDEGLAVKRTAGTNMVSINLDERFQNVSLAKIGADGKPAARCVSSVAEAKQFLQQPAAKGARPQVARPAAQPRLVTAAPLEEK